MQELPTSDPRARRFPLQLALRYRADIFGEWHSATTENISLSGVLFRSPHKIKSDSAIDLDIRLPEEISGPAPVHLVGRARVVRVVEPRFIGQRHAAAEFVMFRLPRSNGDKPASVLPADGSVQHQLFSQLAIILGSSELLLDRADLSTDVRPIVSRIHGAAKTVAAGLRHLIR